MKNDLSSKILNYLNFRQLKKNKNKQNIIKDKNILDTNDNFQPLII